MHIQNPRIRSCANLQPFRLFLAKFFGSLLKKIKHLIFSLKSKENKLATKKTEITIQIVGQFRFLSCGGFEITQKNHCQISKLFEELLPA